MASFGNTGASSLISSANAAAAKTQALNDSLANYQYELSAKDDASYNAYQSYLSSQAKKYSNDPTKTLTYEKALTSAQKSYTSATIGRIGTQVNYGTADLNTKYNTLSQLRDAAMQNGDDALAQSLESQMASTSVAIQNKQLSDAAAADRSSRTASTALNKGYTEQVSRLEDGVKKLNAAKLSGSISPANYDKGIRELYGGNDKQPGIIAIVQDAVDKTGDPNGTWQTKLDTYAADHTVQAAVNGVGAAANDAGNTFGKTIVKQADGTYTFHDRPASEVIGNQLMRDANGNIMKDTAGHAITVPNYAAPQAFTDNKKNINGFQYATNFDTSTGQPAPGTGAQAIRQIEGRDINIDDPSGVPYFFNEAGQKKFIGKDPVTGKPIMGNDPEIVKGETTGKFKDNIPSSNASGHWYDLHFGEGGTNRLDSAKGVIRPGSSITSNLLGNQQHMIDRQNAAAALAKAQAAVAAARATMAPTVAARIATPAVAKNLTPAGKAVIAAAPIKTPTVSQAQAASANFVGANGGYQTNITPAKAPQSLAAKIGSFFGF